MPSPTPCFLLEGEGLAGTGQWGWTSCPKEGDGGSLDLCHWVAAETELWEGRGRLPGRGRPPKRSGKHFGSTVERAKPLSPALPAQNRCWCRSGTCGQNCAVREGWGSQESTALKLCRGGVGGGPQAAPRLDSLCPSHKGHAPVSQRLRTGTSKRSQTPSLSSRL